MEFSRRTSSAFLKGLKDNICLPVRMLNTTSLVAMFGLTKLHEEYIMSSKRPLHASSFPYNRQSNWNPPTSQLPPSSSQFALLAKLVADLPVQRITLA
jgi:hypothetical protein